MCHVIVIVMAVGLSALLLGTINDSSKFRFWHRTFIAGVELEANQMEKRGWWGFKVCVIFIVLLLIVRIWSGND